MSVIHVTAGLDLHSGGTSRVVVQMTDALADECRVPVTILTRRAATEGRMLPSNSNRVTRINLDASGIGSLLGNSFRATLSQLLGASGALVIHNHGLWLPANHWASKAALSSRTPLVLQPHGMLEPWALEHRGLKKRIALALYQRRDLEAATVLVATSASEYQNFRTFGLRQPIALIPNGIALPSRLSAPGIKDDAHRTRTVLFLSRVHKVKGLTNLLQAWNEIKPAGWRLKIAGPAEDASLVEEIARQAKEAALAAPIEYVGPLDGTEKEAAYQDADLFVLPSFSENFGVAVAESLSYGVPAITTRGTPWSDLETYQCGWWTHIGVAPLAESLRAAMNLTDTERRAMGARGRRYVERYDWKNIANQTAAVYGWVLGIHERPDCVQSD